MNTLKKAAMNKLLDYVVSDDPMGKLPKMFDLAEKLDRGHMHESKIQSLRNWLLDENSVWPTFAEKLVQEVDRKCLQKFLECFIVNANLGRAELVEELMEKYDCNIPWAILMDPTSACNLHCTGCWAAQYGNRNNLSYETLDSICRQGKELGIYFYIFSGGEPLVRKKDIIKLCEAHNDCYFFAFTNGTLVDDELCRELLRVGNFALAFSIEGDEEATDMRRGEGTYRKVIEAMERMRAHKLLFGYSTCYHRYNTESVGSDEFVDDMIARGCRFSWNFTYMPVGKDAHTDLLATPEQRAFMYRRVREIRSTKPIFMIDFWNDGEFTNGCIAGGKCYLHINAAGDVEPCAFIHYSNVNIHDVTLLEALRSPLFAAYRKGQPFNSNPLRPCPLLDNPEKLAGMVKESGAKSTDMLAPEDVDVLCAKTAPAAEAWSDVADRLWAENPKSRKATCKVS
ncbi:MAG: radical SAM protein [Oscillospiraceae bacterium]|jgi:MoaA/NifB/PqqE/SkfB family radical SAM enzyme